MLVEESDLWFLDKMFRLYSGDGLFHQNFPVSGSFSTSSPARELNRRTAQPQNPVVRSMWSASRKFHFRSQPVPRQVLHFREAYPVTSSLVTARRSLPAESIFEDEGLVGWDDRSVVCWVVMALSVSLVEGLEGRLFNDPLDALDALAVRGDFLWGAIEQDASVFKDLGSHQYSLGFSGGV
jgi:hypothetical protein